MYNFQQIQRQVNREFDSMLPLSMFSDIHRMDPLHITLLNLSDAFIQALDEENKADMCDLLEVAHYINKKVPKFDCKYWKHACGTRDKRVQQEFPQRFYDAYSTTGSTGLFSLLEGDASKICYAMTVSTTAKQQYHVHLTYEAKGPGKCFRASVTEADYA
jgi:hypothetical protein